MVQCRFCESDATCETDIAFQDNSVEHCALCAWHANFYRWMYSVLGESVRKRMQIRDTKEKGDICTRSKLG
jgi:hypothetical protein